MRKGLLFVLILIFSIAPSEARHHGLIGGLWGFFPARHAYRHQHYAHHKNHSLIAKVPSAEPGHNYTIAELVPRNWQLQPHDPHLNGQHFISPDGKGSLTLFATTAEPQANAKHMTTVAFVDGEQIAHLRGEKNWIEVSGIKEDTSFYRKAMLACSGRVWHEVSFEYPTEIQDEMAEFVVRAAKAVQDSENQDCNSSLTADEAPTPEATTASPSKSND